jgi:hypothetical protein
VTTGELEWGTKNIDVTVDEDAELYVVPVDTTSDLITIKDTKVHNESASGHESVTINTYGLPRGNFKIFAIDWKNNISEPSSVITLSKSYNQALNDLYGALSIATAESLLEDLSSYDLLSLDLIDVDATKMSEYRAALVQDRDYLIALGVTSDFVTEVQNVIHSVNMGPL